MDKTLRWLAVVPSAMLALGITFVVSLYILGKAEIYFCPADFLTPSGCFAPWWDDVERGAATFGASLAAVLVVAVATFVAPSQRRKVAWSSYGVGALFTVLIGFWLSFFMQMAATLLAGAITAVIISRTVKSDA